MSTNIFQYGAVVMADGKTAPVERDGLAWVRCLDCEGAGVYPAGHKCASCGGVGFVPPDSNGNVS